MNTGLSPRQKSFADEYLKDHNATQAYIRAGYSAKTAKVAASTLLTNINVKAYIESKQAKITAKLEINTEWVLTKYIHIVNTCAAIHIDKNGVKKCVDPHAANKALEMIARYTGGFIERKKGNTFINNNNIICPGGTNGDSPEKLRADLKRDIGILFPTSEKPNRF